MRGPLSGKTLVVTRPSAQAEPLAQAIEAAGGNVIRFPLLEIAPATDEAPLQAATAEWPHFHLAIFISPNAVDYSLPTLLAQGPWPATLQTAAVGLGTVKALARHGIQKVIAPTERFDSEALLALPALAQVEGWRVALVKGEGGRDLLAETLTARGATVVPIPCYRRLPPPLPASVLTAAWAAGCLDGITVSSSEGLRYLFDLLPTEGRDALARTPLFVPHPRIAEQAQTLGLHQIVLTPPADAGIMEGLLAHPWPAAPASR